MPDSVLSCVILAGGRSRRMGQDKALLELPDGQFLLNRIVEVAHRLCLSIDRSIERSRAPHIAIVTPWPERYQPIVQRPTLWVEDSKEAGPLAGFSQAWSTVQSDWCLLLACDLPNLNEQVLRQWWQWLETDLPGAARAPEASLVRRNQRWEPLCGYYHRRCLSSMKKHLEEGSLPDQKHSQRDFQSWLSTLEIVTYSGVPDEMLFNCNRPDDWRKVIDSKSE